MDKNRKSLVDTYFRKRNIAIEQNGRYGFQRHEIIYALNNNIKIEHSLLDITKIVSIIKGNPELITKIDFNSFNDYKIIESIIKLPEIIDMRPEIFTTERFRNFDSGMILRVLVHQPKLVNLFNLLKFSGNNISELFEKNLNW